MNNAKSSIRPVPVAFLISVYANDNPVLFHRALLSIENQDYLQGDVRIYLCVDGPIDCELEEVVAKHQRVLFKVLRNPTKRGLAASLNKLIFSLQDEMFVFRMDADDYSYPYRVTRQLDRLNANPQIDVLGGYVNEVDSKGNHLRLVKYPTDSSTLRYYIAKRNPIAHPTVCFRREAIDRFRTYPETSVNQDWALWYKSLALGLTLTNLDEVLVDMTISDDFFRRRGASRAVEELNISLSGIRSLHGISWRMIYPLLRFLFRLSPRFLIRMAYSSSFRK